MRNVRFARYAWGVLGFNIIVILWGAYVRASGSGAGCGSHWPLCNGEVVPRSLPVATMIEFAHRVTSGLALASIVILFIWAFRYYRKGHPVRLGAVLSLVFILTEALVGAGLVLFEWVAYDVSFGRVISISIHLVNTFLLLASLTLTAWWASGGAPISFSRRGPLAIAFGVALGGVALIGMSGAVTALGDTVFPAASFAEGLRQDFSPTAHAILRLRIWHPIIAVLVGSYLIVICGLLVLSSNDDIRNRKQVPEQFPGIILNQPLYTRNFALTLIALVCIQLVAGLINVVLLAPIWMQIAHLFLADSVWITLILLTAVSFANPVAAAETSGESGQTSIELGHEASQRPI